MNYKELYPQIKEALHEEMDDYDYSFIDGREFNHHTTICLNMGDYDVELDVDLCGSYHYDKGDWYCPPERYIEFDLVCSNITIIDENGDVAYSENNPTYFNEKYNE